MRHGYTTEWIDMYICEDVPSKCHPADIQSGALRIVEYLEVFDGSANLCKLRLWFNRHRFISDQGSYLVT
jgi:hypothetical protein